MATALMATGTPFHQVEARGAQLSDADLAVELERLKSVSPAALVMYAGGDSNEGKGSSVEEDAIYHVICVVAGRSQESATAGDAATAGVYKLMAWCRKKLHDKDNITGIINPMYWRGNKRVTLPGALLTVAAFAVEFRAHLDWTSDTAA